MFGVGVVTGGRRGTMEFLFEIICEVLGNAGQYSSSASRMKRFEDEAPFY